MTWHVLLVVVLEGYTCTRQSHDCQPSCSTLVLRVWSWMCQTRTRHSARWGACCGSSCARVVICGMEQSSRTSGLTFPRHMPAASLRLVKVRRREGTSESGHLHSQEKLFPYSALFYTLRHANTSASNRRTADMNYHPLPLDLSPAAASLPAAGFVGRCAFQVGGPTKRVRKHAGGRHRSGGGYVSPWRVCGDRSLR